MSKNVDLFGYNGFFGHFFSYFYVLIAETRLKIDEICHTLSLSLTFHVENSLTTTAA